MMTEKSQIGEEVLIAIRRVIRAVDLHSRQLSHNYNLTGPQALLLKEVAAAGRIVAGELAKKLSLSQATITDIVKRLEQRGLVYRLKDVTDRRRVLIELSPAGLELIQAAPPLLQERFIQRFGDLQDWEQTLLLSSLQRVAALMDAESLDASPLLSSGPPQISPETVRSSLSAGDAELSDA